MKAYSSIKTGASSAPIETPSPPPTARVRGRHVAAGLAGGLVLAGIISVVLWLIWIVLYILIFVVAIGAGVAGATISTAQAYIADTTSLENRPKGMALIGMAFGLGFTFGPLLGYLAVPGGETVEREVSEKIEDAVSTINGVRTLRSVSVENVSQVIIEFELEMELDREGWDRGQAGGRVIAPVTVRPASPAAGL